MVVAHPDDETLWCGGYILNHPEVLWRIVTLTRATDADRAPKFRQVLERLGAEGEMADLDDGPGQTPLVIEDVTETIVRLLAGKRYQMILTHGPDGEYTRHRRHAECSQAVLELWQAGEIDTSRVWMFAYNDGGGAHTPRACSDADRRDVLGVKVWREKLRLITEVYGFGPDSWEARNAPREEAFWCFSAVEAAARHARARERQP